MKFYQLAVSLFLSLLLSFPISGAEKNEPLQFEEVFRLLRTHLTDIPEEELSRLAAMGLLKELGGKVEIGPESEGSDGNGEAITRKAVHGDSHGYIRVGEVNSDLPAEFKAAYDSIASTNRLKGLIIDLRFSSGDDYEAAAKTADLFAKADRPLLKLGERELRSTPKSSALTLPLAVLVNQETSGAAEALAAVLREIEMGLVIGAPTAGEARLFQSFRLSTGQELRVGSIPVQLPGGRILSTAGVTPDIRVRVEPEHEKAFFENPFAQISRILPHSGGTNILASSTNRVRPLNEAELVRRHREGLFPEDISIDPSAELFEDKDRPRVVTDPALARGLDFLKGVSVLQQFRPL